MEKESQKLSLSKKDGKRRGGEEEKEKGKRRRERRVEEEKVREEKLKRERVESDSGFFSSPSVFHSYLREERRKRNRQGGERRNPGYLIQKVSLSSLPTLLCTNRRQKLVV